MHHEQRRMRRLQPLEQRARRMIRIMDLSQDRETEALPHQRLALLHPMAEDGILHHQVARHVPVLRTLPGETEDHGSPCHAKGAASCCGAYDRRSLTPPPSESRGR